MHSELELFLMLLEHAASGSASRATMAVVINIFLEPIVCCLLWLMNFSPLWSETPMAPPRSAPRGFVAPDGNPRGHLSPSG